MKKAEKYYGKAPTDKIDVGLLTGIQSNPLRTNVNMETKVEGLWGAGGVTWTGCAWQGAVSAPGGVRGAGIGTCQITGRIAGQNAGAYAAAAKQGNIDTAQVEQYKNEVYKPLGRKSGVNPVDIIREIAEETIIDLDQTIRRSGERMEKAIAFIEQKKASLDDMVAVDGHGLTKCMEAKGIVMNAEAMHRSGLLRKESRGSFNREDYPDRDDMNPPTWTIVELKKDNTLDVFAEPVPFENYRYKPE